jgi:glycosyltransferase involved in cell wall biosynthesis
MTPFWPDPNEMLEQMLALRLLDVAGSAERLVAIRTPSYLLRHPRKVVWFLHHHRPAYDLRDTEYGLPATPESARVREALVQTDNHALREATRLFTNSNVVSERLRRYNDLDSTVLYPPLGDTTGYRCESFGDYVFFPSRITPLKRQWLAIEAMAHVRSDVRLVVAGSPDLPEHLVRLHDLIEQHQLHDRVELIPEWISEERKHELYARALACVYIPYDEDSYGYVSLESFQSRKAVVTCTDSGGTLELIEDGVNGFAVDPEPRQLARAMDRLMEDRGLAERLGRAGHDHVAEVGITWDNVVENLTR